MILAVEVLSKGTSLGTALERSQQGRLLLDEASLSDGVRVSKKLVIGGISVNVTNYVKLYSISKEVMTVKPMFTLSNIFISLPIG